ncbi:MAG: ABC transporter ATP-binding protein [Alphaproteobacteria bacterium]|nr:ABC transporter ATP-binding protein [Alphaproteobacteria bacterium]
MYEGNSIVQFIDISKSYDGESLAVKNVNLNVKQGEFLTFLGPSGSGKTSCLMMLAGFESVTDGHILLGGEEINHIPPHLRNIGMVFQNYALFPHKTVAENIAYPLWVRRTLKGEINEKVQKALKMVRLEGLADRMPLQLSGGQQQRVAVARALVFNPQIILMDEPLSALDKSLREEMQYEIRSLHENLNISVVYVTHDQGEALVMSDRIAVLNGGSIEQLASPAELYKEPKNSFVAQFIGENNFLPGTIDNIKTNLCVTHLETGDPVQATPVAVSHVGQKTLLSVRPESIVINPDSAEYQNRFNARVMDLIFHGDHLRARMSVCGNDNFIVKISNEVNRLSPLEVGKEIGIGWRASDCRALDELE